MDQTPMKITLLSGAATHPAAQPSVLLDGSWMMAEQGSEGSRIADTVWADAIPVTVPGSVHNALFMAGKIPDPMVGLNDAQARVKSLEKWWFKRHFARPAGTGHRLEFEGVGPLCSVWLNGIQLGSHNGMFGGPSYDISSVLQDNNLLIVKVDAIPPGIPGGMMDGFTQYSNNGWLNTVTFNCVYGWHYAALPAQGIWRSVKIAPTNPVELKKPFIATKSAASGTMDLFIPLRSAAQNGGSGEIRFTIEPDNFVGSAFHYSARVSFSGDSTNLRYQFSIPSPRLWWPAGFGEQNLYRLKASFIPDAGQSDSALSIFGIRTVTTPTFWGFVVNDRPIFIKGANWCTLDALMRFDRDRYDRFLELAKRQHTFFLRAWGGGLVETDDFYDLCDRKGIMVMQEWPTAWMSAAAQPKDVLEETVRLNMPRLRNHPSLVLWTGGNEGQTGGSTPNDQMMARYATQFDGTRPYHWTEPAGGSVHDYGPWWGGASVEDYLRLTADFIGEFGQPSYPNLESTLRFMMPGEQDGWPTHRQSLEHHTPTFNNFGGFQRLAGDFTEMSTATLDRFIMGTQLSQVVGLRHTLERARTLWPSSKGTCYYKLTDVYPGAAWSTIDWYGVPKIPYYFVQDAYAPVHACMVFDHLQFSGESISLPVFALDDIGYLTGAWTITVRAFNESLKLIKKTDFSGSGPVDCVASPGSFSLSSTETQSTPLFLVVDLKIAGKIVDRSFYFANYAASKDCLFNLPSTRVTAISVGSDSIRVANTGGLPAVAVNLQSGNGNDTFLVSDNYFWLDSGETRMIGVNDASNVRAFAWNSSTQPTPFPAILSVSASIKDSAGSVQIQFNTPLDRTSLQNAASYEISNGVIILSAVASSDRRSVTLSVGGMNAGSHYALSCTEICDQSAPPQCLTQSGIDFVPNSSLMGY
jgi:beta-mannosidase